MESLKGLKPGSDLPELKKDPSEGLEERVSQGSGSSWS